MKMQKRVGAAFISRTLPVAALLIGFAACASADTTWTVNATFTGPHSAANETATGTFTTRGGSSSVAPAFLSWDVSFTGPNTFADSSATPATTVIGENLNPWIGDGGGPSGYPKETELSFAVNPGFSPYVDVYLDAPLTDGGAVHVIGGYDCPGCGTLQRGTLPAEALPYIHSGRGPRAGRHRSSWRQFLYHRYRDLRAPQAGAIALSGFGCAWCSDKAARPNRQPVTSFAPVAIERAASSRGMKRL